MSTHVVVVVVVVVGKRLVDISLAIRTRWRFLLTHVHLMSSTCRSVRVFGRFSTAFRKEKGFSKFILYYNRDLY